MAAAAVVAGCADARPAAPATTDIQAWQIGFEPVAPVHVGEQATVTLDIRNAGGAARTYELWPLSLRVAAIEPAGSYLLAQEGTAGPGAQSLEAPDTGRINEVGKRRYAATHFLVQPGGVVRVTQRLPWVFVSPGDYSVEGLAPPENPRTNRAVPLNTYARIPTATVRVVGVPLQSEAWGLAAEGVSCRVRVAATIEGGPPAMVMDIRNTGKRALLTTQFAGMWQMEWDGAWYRWGEMIDAKTSPLGPGRTYRDIPLELRSAAWKNEKGEMLQLAPGPHTVRVATSCMATDGGAAVRVESAPVQITIPATP
jgi:hypothetical protein